MLAAIKHKDAPSPPHSHHLWAIVKYKLDCNDRKLNYHFQCIHNNSRMYIRKNSLKYRKS